MKLLYQISIACYSIIIRIASIFNPKANQWIIGRKNVLQAIKSQVNKNDKIAWFHCASLGEFEQGKPVIEGLRAENPDYKILITFFSPSGYELRKNYEGADYIFYLPIDTAKNAKMFLKLIQPNLAFFVKYEFWYHYLKELNHNNIPTYLVSGVFRENQIFFKWYGKWYRKMLNYFTHFFVQNETSSLLLQEHGFKNVSITGDTRFDRVYENSKTPKELPIINAFKNNQPIIIGGSSWPSEETILANYYAKFDPNFKLIIAPHDIKENHIKKIVDLFDDDCILYSDATGQNVIDKKVLIIDNIGLLSNIYQYTDIAFVGGGFSGALHNILEPTSFGNYIVFGPRHEKFHEAQELIDYGGASTINNASELSITIEKCSKNTLEFKKKNIKFIQENIGSVKSILKSF